MIFDGKKRESVITVEIPFPTELIKGSVRATVGRGTTRVRGILFIVQPNEERILNSLIDQ